MPNKKISDLTAKGAILAATDLIEISESNGQGGYNTKSVTGANVLSSKQDTLVSGTNIKTINSTTLLGAGDFALQPTLQSGTNIKTINSTTLLGAGDVAVQPTLVSGTNIKTINSTTILGSGDLPVQDTLVSGTNIKTINGSTVLGSGNLVVGGGGFHMLTQPIATWLYAAQAYNTNQSTTSLSTGVNTMMLSLFYPATTFTISELSINVTTAASSASNVKILVYSDDGFGYPRAKLIESSALSMTTTGAKVFLTSYTFTAGTKYWMGVIIDAQAGAVVTSLSTNTLYTRNLNYSVTQTGMSIGTTFATPPALNTSFATSSNFQAAAVFLKI